VSAKRIFVRDIWIEGTLSQIQRSIEGSPEGEERRRHLDELAADLAALHPESPGSADAIRAGVERAVAVGTITEDEARGIME
jgi:hypothetical protein